MGSCAHTPIHTYSRVWTKEEDESIRDLVARHGTRSWSVIAEKIASNKGTSCVLFMGTPGRGQVHTSPTHAPLSTTPSTEQWRPHGKAVPGAVA